MEEGDRKRRRSRRAAILPSLPPIPPSRQPGDPRGAGPGLLVLLLSARTSRLLRIPALWS